MELSTGLRLTNGHAVTKTFEFKGFIGYELAWCLIYGKAFLT